MIINRDKNGNKNICNKYKQRNGNRFKSNIKNNKLIITLKIKK